MISSRFLSEDERVRIADQAAEGLGPSAIGALFGRAASKISRELRRNLPPSGRYRPFHAHAHVAAATRRRRPRPDKLSLCTKLDTFVRDKLAQRWSPQQISWALRVQHPDDPGCGSARNRSTKRSTGPAHGCCTAQSLPRYGPDETIAAATRQVRAPRRFAAPMLSVHDRAFEADDRSQAGHWEGNLIVGPNHRSGIGTLVERQTRYVKLLHLPRQDLTTLHAALVAAPGALPASLRRSLTRDQGSARHLDITADTGIPIYFCDAASPWQRGSNENTNGLLRQYFPKSTDLSRHSPRDLARVEFELNTRPRLVLADKTPYELFEQLLASQNHRSWDDRWKPTRRKPFSFQAAWTRRFPLGGCSELASSPA